MVPTCYSLSKSSEDPEKPKINKIPCGWNTHFLKRLYSSTRESNPQRMKVNRGMKNLQKEILSCPFHHDTGFWFTNDWSIFELVTHVCPHFHRLSSDDSPKGHRTGHRLRTQTHNFTPVSPGPTASAMNHTGRFFSLWNDIWDKVLIYQYIKAIKTQTSFIAFSTNRKLGITCTRRYLRDFSGGPAAKTPNAGVLGSTFGQRTKIPHAATKTGYSQINK